MLVRRTRPSTVLGTQAGACDPRSPSGAWHVLHLIRNAAGGELVGKTIGLLGLAYKAGTGDLRGSPAVELARLLVASGAEVRAFDPAVEITLDHVRSALSAMEAVRGADVLLIATEWEEFAMLDLEAVRDAMTGDTVVDSRNLLDPVAVRAAGLRYAGVGR